MRYLTSILIIVAIVGLGFVGLSHYVDIAYGQTNSFVATSDTTTGISSASGAQALALLNRLSGINLDGKVFNTAAFKSLQDFSVVILPQPVGRDNPYLPTGSTVVTTTKPVVTKITTPKFLLKQ